MRSSIVMSIATFASRILGLVREQVMAMTFGASHLTDAFLVAYRIPNLLRDLLAEGAFSASFVPVFTEVKIKGGDNAARELLYSIAILLALITGIVGVLIFIFTPEIMGAFAPSFKSDPGKFAIAVNLTRWMASYLLCVSIAALFTGVLNSHKIFFLPSLSPALFNVVMISFCLLLPTLLEKYGYSPVYCLGMAVMVGGFCQALMQLPMLFRKGYLPLIPKVIFSATAVRVVKRLGPGLIGFAAGQMNLFVTTVLASSIIGAVSWLNYAFRLFQFPVGIFGVAVANSHLVHFSYAIKSGDYERAQKLIRESYHLILSMLLPATVLLYVLASEMTHIIFEHGHFKTFDTIMTAKALCLYAIGLPGYGIYKLLVPTFYALDRQRIPTITTLATVGVNIVLCIWLTPKFGFQVLAFGTTVTMLLNSLILMEFLQHYMKLPATFFIGMPVLKYSAASLVMGVVTYFAASRFFYFDLSVGLLTKICQLSMLLGLGGTIYLLAMGCMGEREVLLFVWEKVKRFRAKLSIF
ncbi:MAG: murein biosynthesis integral membrane protein MurJ [Oligoflexia bacterium]|nr:murein biosynthesis integral membrane protein MurJ [Oligoflexia bacterium]MBF0366680.1 murein biosynthesis integral membrane protein MurJ [Oligoflexia bacterium]